MPEAAVVFYAEEDGTAALLAWLDGLREKVRDKFLVRIERLQERGSELRRPEAAMLRDGIYELRVRNMRINYRVLYFFHEGRAVLSHGLTKTDRVPEVEIGRAISRRAAFVRAPERHTYTESEVDDDE